MKNNAVNADKQIQISFNMSEITNTIRKKIAKKLIKDSVNKVSDHQLAQILEVLTSSPYNKYQLVNNSEAEVLKSNKAEHHIHYEHEFY